MHSISQQATQAAAANKSDSKDTDASILSFRETALFPIFSEMYLRTSFPYIGFVFRTLVYVLQIISSSLMLGSPLVWPDKPLLIKIVHGFIDWGISSQTTEESLPQLILGLVLFMIFNVFFVITTAYYKKNRSFTYMMLYLARLLYVIIHPIIVPYFAAVSGIIASRLYLDYTPINLGFFTVYFIMFLWTSHLITVVSIIDDYSIILTRNPHTCWDYQIHMVLNLVIMLSAFLQPFLSLFAPWVTLLMGVCVAIGYVYVIYLLYFFPCHLINMNLHYICLMITCLFYTIIHWIKWFIESDLHYLICLFVPAVFYVISYIVVGIFLKKRREAIKFKLSYASISEDEEITEIQKRDHFDTIRFSSYHDAIAHIHIGLIYHSDLLIDFSFLRYMLENYAEEPIVYAIAQVAAIFPSEIQFFSFCLQAISRYQNHNIGQNFMIHQMKRINIIRQSSVSEDASQQLFDLQKMSSDSISQVRGFWPDIIRSKTSISFASLKYLRDISEKTQNLFLDAINNFPNNVSILQEYIKFQIECLGDYSGTIKTARKLYSLEQGKNLVTDYVFISFINGYRDYIFDRVIDGNGHFIKDHIHKSDSSQSFSGPSMSASNSMDLSEVENDEIFDNFYTNGKLRLALQRKVSSIKLPSIQITYFATFLIFLVMVLLYTVILIVLPKGPEKSELIYQMCYQSGMVATSIEYMMIISSCKYFIKKGVFNLPDEIFIQLNISPDEITKNPSILTDSDVSLFLTAKDLEKKFEELLPILLGSTLTAEYEQFTINDIHRFQYDAPKVIYLENSSQRTMIQYLLNKYLFVDYGNNNLDFLEKFCFESLLNTIGCSDSLRALQKHFQNQGLNNVRALKTTLYTMLGVSIFVIVLTFTVLKGICIYLLVKDMKRISNVLKLVKPEDITESLKPINLRSRDSIIKTNVTHGVNDYNRWFVSFVIEGFFAIVLSMTNVTAAIFFYKVKMQGEDKIYLWFTYNTVRYIAVMSMVNIFFLELTPLLPKPEASLVFDKYLKIAQEAQADLVSSIIGSDRTFNEIFFTGENVETSDENYATNAQAMSPNSRFLTVLSQLEVVHVTSDPVSMRRAVCELAFMFNQHTFHDFKKIEDGILNYSSTLYQSSIRDTQYIIIFGFVYAFISFSFAISQLSSMKKAVNAVGQLLLMLPPVRLVQNGTLDKLEVKKSDYNDVSMTQSQIIIANTKQACVTLDSKLIIQYVNQSLCNMTGFTTDQVLGQPISFLVPKTSFSQSSSGKSDDLQVDQFYKAFDTISDPRNPEDDYIEIKTKMINESGHYITVRVMLCGFRNGQNEIDSFTCVFSDLTAVVKQKEKVNKARERIDHLLEAMLPTEVLPYLRTGKESIFYSEQATVSFIEFVGLTSMVHMYAPKQMMTFMNKICISFEDAAREYPAIHTLKTNDDLYIYCCGLFDFKDSPEIQASQSVDFALQVLKTIEDVNEEFETAITLRIGISMGGPLIGSVLDVKTPTFDLLGPVIGQAVKLQNDGQEGVVQVTQSVKNYLDPKKYIIKEGNVLYGARNIPDQSFIIDINDEYSKHQ